MTACAPILTVPTKNLLPYSEGNHSEAVLGSTHEEIARLLGQPHIKLDSDGLWIYGLSRIKASGFGEYVHDYEALLIEFNKGEAVSKEIFYENNLFTGGCWGHKRELCLHPVWEPSLQSNDEPKKLSRRYSAVTSIRHDDAQAKLFKPRAGYCSVYIYTSASIFNDRQMPPVSSIGIIRDEPVPADGYLYLQSPPQGLTLIAGSSAVSIDCRADSIHFYQLNHYFFNASDDIRVTSVNSDTGFEAVRSRRLLVNWN